MFVRFVRINTTAGLTKLKDGRRDDEKDNDDKNDGGKTQTEDYYRQNNTSYSAPTETLSQ